MNPRLLQLQGLRDELLSTLYTVMQSGTKISDAQKGLIAEQLTWLTDSIEELETQTEQEEEQPHEPPPPNIPNAPPELTPAPYASSNINALKYDPENQSLFIKYQDKYPSTNGPIYQYSGVPSYIFDVIRRGAVAPKGSGGNQWHHFEKGITPSHGASVDALLKKGGFEYARIS